MGDLEGERTCGNHPGIPKRGHLLYRGTGKLSLNFRGYEPCHNAEEVIQEAAYDPEADLENPTGSVFCSHGQDLWFRGTRCQIICTSRADGRKKNRRRRKEGTVRAPMERSFADDKELREIFERTYGPVKRKQAGWERKTVRAASEDAGKRRPPEKPAILHRVPPGGRLQYYLCLGRAEGTGENQYGWGAE